MPAAAPHILVTNISWNHRSRRTDGGGELGRGIRRQSGRHDDTASAV